MRLIRTRQAEDDLIDIWLYIARDNLHAADRIVEQLDARTGLLARYPEFGRIRGDIAPDVRSVAMGDYIILYRLRAEQVQIVRYVHGRRRLKGLV